jgi:hypothetical protein
MIYVTIFNSKYLLFGNLEIYWSNNKVSDSKILLSDTDSVKNCFENSTIFNVGKTTIISFKRKPISINFNCKLCNNLISCSSVLKILEFC